MGGRISIKREVVANNRVCAPIHRINTLITNDLHIFNMKEIDLRKCKKGDMLISNKGNIFTLIGKLPDESSYDQFIGMGDGWFTGVSNNGENVSSNEFIVSIIHKVKDSIYLGALVHLFIKEVEAYSKIIDRGYYNRWFSTVSVALLLQVSAKRVRDELTKLEKRGLVKSKRTCNWIEWNPSEVEGFKDHEYSCYLTRI